MTTIQTIELSENERQVVQDFFKLIDEMSDIDRYGQIYHDEAMKAIKAIPPAESQEVIYSDDGYIANCPNCNCVYEIDDLVWGCNYCPHCGQALKWEIWEE